MPVLPNVRHEKFCQALFEGKSATESYTLAGYRPHQGNSSRLRWFEMVQSRLRELQAQAAQSSEITVQSICKELDEANQVAREKGQANAMVSASALRAKLAGLLTDRVQVETTNGGMTLDDENTSEDVATRIAKEAGANLTPQELEQFMELMRGWHESMQQFLAAHRAKQVEAIPAHALERKRLALAANKQTLS